MSVFILKCGLIIEIAEGLTRFKSGPDNHHLQIELAADAHFTPSTARRTVIIIRCGSTAPMTTAEHVTQETSLTAAEHDAAFAPSLISIFTSCVFGSIGKLLLP